MQWLISGVEPESLYVPILTEERLRSGVIGELIKLLPWYKRTARMEPILAMHLVPVLRSGFERSYVLRQLEGLDIPPEASAEFLHKLEESGACRFAEPRLFYNQVIQTASYEKGVVVQGQYMKNRLVISETLAGCLRLLDGFMPTEEYLGLLAEHLGGTEYARRACRSLAHQGLLMGCDSPRPTALDHGPLRWNLEMTDGGRLLGAEEWERRLRFVEESFQGFYFQSRNFFAQPPIQLWGDFGSVMDSSRPEYFWNLSFKLQKFGQAVPVNLRLTAPLPDTNWYEFGLQSPFMFTWDFVADLRRGGEQLVEEMRAKLVGQQLAYKNVITLLADGGVPAGVAPLSEHAYLKFYFMEPPEAAADALSVRFRRAIHRSCKPHLRRQGCGALLSLYVDGRGGVHTCPLEGAAGLGHIEDGAHAVESRRQEFIRRMTGACRFGLDPCTGREGGKGDELPQSCRDDVTSEWTLQAFHCP